MLDKTDTAWEATKTPKPYRCTICEDQRSYKNISDWRKHEREHVDVYVCMLKGPVDETEGGIRCSLCGTLDPTDKHLGEHNTQLCGQEVPGPFTCKRRVDLVRHLKKCHNVQKKAQGEAVADKCKKTTNKQAWSCGFCVHLFHTFGDRLKHIAKHFEDGQTLDQWNTTNVIEGLLLQPGTAKVWKKPLDWSLSSNIWKRDVIRDLQDDLELGPTDRVPATALVERVYNARQPDLDVLNDHSSFNYAPIQPSSDHQQSQFVNPAETIHNSVLAPGGNSMPTYDYSTQPTSFLDEDSNPNEGTWPPNPDQTESSAADPYIGYSVNQEHSNATTEWLTWSPPAMLSDDPDGTDM